MADNPNSDQINLDEATQASEVASGDTILNAAEIFQQQLEQMTAWKQQLGTQMDLMRKDGIKLLERQKALAQDRKTLADDRATLTAEREQIQKLQAELNAETQRLSQRAGELEHAQNQLAQWQAQREQAERELAARQKHLEENEARRLAEDVRLKEGMEQLEGQRHQLAEARQQIAQERDALNHQNAELQNRAKQLEEQSQSLNGREGSLHNAQQEVQKAQAELRARHDELNHREHTLNEKLRAAEAELQARQAAAHAAEQELAQERQALAKARQDLQKKIEAFEHEQAEQLEALGKQTKRLTERRTQIEAAEANLEQALAERIAQATKNLQEELAASKNGQHDRIAQLEAHIQQAEAAAHNWQKQHAQLQQELSDAHAQITKVRDELREASASLERVASERSAAAEQLAKQIEQAKAEEAKWQKAVEEARTQATGDNKEVEDARSLAKTTRKELEKLKIHATQLQTAKDELEFQLLVRSEDAAKQLDALRHELTVKIEERDTQIRTLREQLAAAPKADAKGESKDSRAGKETAAQIQTLEKQRDELAKQLISVQDKCRRLEEESILAKNAMEGKLLALEQKCSTLEAEKATWKKQNKAAPPAGSPADAQAQKHSEWQRQRLLRQAKALRTFRQQIRETQSTLQKGRDEIAQQREQLRARKENLEQVKRLLEKQEMVMARKLADHNAIKTVAAVGIFVIMVLGSVYFGVYRFVHPVYRSEAVVQLAPPKDLVDQASSTSPELEAWFNKQMEFMRSPEMTNSAWKLLRSNEEKYAMHDVRDEWAATLPKNLTMTLIGGSRQLVIRYTGPDPQGVSQVCNAMAAAYMTPGMRDTTEATKTQGAGSQIVAKATAPLYPVEDTRMTIALSTVAIVLFVSLVLVMIFRHFIARQLKEIDQMADAQDLEDVKGDLPENEAHVATE